MFVSPSQYKKDIRIQHRPQGSFKKSWEPGWVVLKTTMSVIFKILGWKKNHGKETSIQTGRVGQGTWWSILPELKNNTRMYTERSELPGCRNSVEQESKQ